MSISSVKAHFAFSAIRAVAIFIGIFMVSVLSSSVALAQATITLTPDNAFNLVGTTHTVTATLDSYAFCDTGSNAGAACSIDADCFDQGGEVCSKAGFPIGFVINTGPNSAGSDTTVNLSTDINGQVDFTYTGSGGPGIDTIQACGDLFFIDPGETTAECISEDGQGDGDVASNIVTKEWGVATLVLTPPGAYNLTGTSHTVKATINGFGLCDGGSNDGSYCSIDSDCESDVCSSEGIPVGFQVTGQNSADTAVDAQQTDVNGQVSFTYPDTNGAGVDTILACADLFVDAYELTSECLGEVGSDWTDIGSNPAQKVWSAVHLDLTPVSAYNPIGTTHVLTATLSGMPKHCAAGQGFGVCSTDADCSNVSGSCTYAGYPTFFAGVGECSGGINGGAACTVDGDCDSNDCSGGPNLGELLVGVTNAAGVATTSYSSTVEGEDKLQACLDGDPAGFGIDDEDTSTLIGCLKDVGEFDIPSNIATKGWFANFITGGAGTYATVNKKKTMQFSGIIGKDSGLPGIHGQWNAVAKDGTTGKTVSCHFDTFTKLVFSGPAAKTPASTHNTATWTTGPGKCNDGSTPILTAIAVDYGEGKKVPRDTINVTGDSRFDTGGTKALTTGNLQVHSIILP